MDTAFRLYFRCHSSLRLCLSVPCCSVTKAQLYRGRGGEMMREAVCRLIACIATAGVELDAAAVAVLQVRRN